MTAKIKIQTAFLFFVFCLFPQFTGAAERRQPPAPDLSQVRFSPNAQYGVRLRPIDNYDHSQRVLRRLTEWNIPVDYDTLVNPGGREGTFYMLKVDAFESRDEAQTFGHDILRPLNLPYRIDRLERRAPPPPSQPQVWTQEAPRALPHVSSYDGEAVHEIADREYFLSVFERPVANHFIFSIRPEFIAGTSVSAAGLSIELGILDSNGFYFTSHISGGGVYYGGVLNFGKAVLGYENQRHIIGLSGGYINILYLVRFTENRQDINVTRNRTRGNNLAFGGLFWKLLTGDERNFDITNRVLFGSKENPIYYDRESSEVIFQRKFNATYSVSLGYTLTRRQRLSGNGDILPPSANSPQTETIIDTFQHTHASENEL